VEARVSEENVQIVKQIFDAAARRDAGAVLASYDEDVEVDFSRAPQAGMIGGRVYRGHDGLRRWFREWHDAWVDVRDDLEEVIDAGDHVISVVTQHGRGRASGVDVEQKHVSGVWTLRDGKVIRVVWFPTRADAVAAVQRSPG
jgi:ketosteroid isomerase-like protein